jgi:photosystem II stability/assembly factor-like uncharacterized protein
MKSFVQIPWFKMGLPPALLTAVLFGSNFLDAIPNLVSEVDANTDIPTMQLRHRNIADNLYGVDFFDELHGIATGYYGTVLRTQDGGENWTWHSTGETELLRRVHMISTNEALSIGHRGTIYRTDDGGGSWQAVHREADTMLRAVALSNDGQKGWAVGNRTTILRTEDGGQTWRRQKLTGYTGRDLPTWNGLAILDSDTVALAGEFGTLAFSSDGGESWTVKESPTGVTLNDIVVTQGGFLAVGLDGTAVAITTRPNDYELKALSTGSTEHLFALSIDANGEGVAVGRRSMLGVIGEHFSAIPISDSLEISYNWFADVDVTETGTLWSVGRRGLVAGSPSGGGEIQVKYRLGGFAPSVALPTRTANSNSAKILSEAES